jgi:hypothetical protein
MMRRGGPTEDELILADEIRRQREEEERRTTAPTEPEEFRTQEHVVPSSRLRQPPPGPSVPADSRRTAQVENQPPARPKRERKPSSMPLLLGALGGLVIGGAAVWFLKPPEGPNVAVPDGGTPPIPKPGPTPPPPEVILTAQDARQLLEAGEPARALAAYEKIGGDSIDVLAGRGQARWLAYVRSTHAAGGQLDGNADAVTQARQDLNAAITAWKNSNDAAQERDAARAVLWKGLIEESLGNLDAAANVYQSEAGPFSPENQAILRSNATRLAVLRADEAGEEVSALPPGDVLLGLIILLQVPDQPLAGKTADPTQQEAGFKFWEALMLANRFNYSQAKVRLEQALEIHKKQRDRLAGKGLNPLSDPREQIFERCCKDLLALWELRDRIYKLPGAETVVKAKGFAPALDAAFSETKRLDTTVKALSDKLKPAENKTLVEAVDEVVKARETAEADLKARDTLLDKLAKDLKGAGIDEPKLDAGISKLVTARADAEKRIKDTLTALEKAGVKEPELAKAVEQLAMARNDSDALLKNITDRLQTGNYLNAKAGRGELLTGLDRALAKAAAPAVTGLTPHPVSIIAGAASTAAQMLTIASQVDKFRKAMEEAVAKLEEERKTAEARLKETTDKYESRLAQVRTPAQVIDLWLLALADRSAKEEAAAALADADRVAKDKDASPEVQAKALAVKALALRNQGDYAAARQAFTESQKHPGFATDKFWGKAVATAAEQLQNPSAFVVPGGVAAALDPKGIIEAIDAGLKLFPQESYPRDHARLLARRAQAKLDNNDLEGAADDAEAAVKGGAGVEGQLIAARIAERQGNAAGAAQLYREVLKVAKSGSPVYRQAQLGLARTLLRATQQPAPKTPAANEVSAQLILLTTLLAAPGDSPTDANVEEALKLADELIASGEYLGHIIRADALASMRRYTDALQEYEKGVRLLKVLPREYDDVLDRIIKNHPSLRTDVVRSTDPELGNRRFDEGLQFFFDGKHARAEKAFVTALDNARDARYLYYLGLTRWLQGKKSEAADDFKAAALLERQSRPAPRIISDSLERVQGEPRSVLNEYRP